MKGITGCFGNAVRLTDERLAHNADTTTADLDTAETQNLYSSVVKILTQFQFPSELI